MAMVPNHNFNHMFHWSLPAGRQGYTGTTVANAMNHVQRAVSYVTPRNAASTNGNAVTHSGLPVTPYREGFLAGGKTHDVQHKLPSGAIPAGGARTISRLALSGAISPKMQPNPNPPQSLAWAQIHPDVSAVAQNLGYSIGKNQGSPSVGFIKTGIALQGRVSGTVGGITRTVSASVGK